MQSPPSYSRLKDIPCRDGGIAPPARQCRDRRVRFPTPVLYDAPAETTRRRAFMPTVGVVARFTIQADKTDEFARVANEFVVAPSQQEQGCIRYELWQDNEDPTIFAMVEEWESDEDLNAHLANAGSRGGPSLGDYMAGPPDMRRFSKTG
ncbi:MAG: antibiotic biosynthesis monooxygenase [Dehalococcoidia bacterium]|nr:antibiotic biosynthesis monooxygenase [Dehalococcoidia bacterium]